ncbi:MAG TPA: squalene/phytoene synthase family protein [Rhodanobacteraceae bacterium]|nr:squalene/phytoene synthase family protein [Rhodanobacteraceae bacterium]
MSAGAFDQYLTQWREASPQRSTAWLFLRPAEQRRYGALAALEREWIKVLREVTEPQVATIKLGWWREEMQRACAGAASHPLTQALFAEADACDIASVYWTAAIDAAALAVDPVPPADFAAQRAAALPFAQALAQLETALWFGPGKPVARACEAVVLAWLLDGLMALGPELARGRSPLPMNLLARHGLAVAGLATDGAARRGALHDYVAELAQALVTADRMEGPLTLFRATELTADRATLRRAARAPDPLRGLVAPRHGLRNLIKTWRAARAWRRAARRAD